jgi:rubredoxin
MFDLQIWMKKYQCCICDYIYDPQRGDFSDGIPPNTAFDGLPTDWICPTCGVGKRDFEPINVKKE